MSFLTRLFLLRFWRFFPKKKYCCVCEQRVPYFLPYRGGWKDISSALKSVRIVGSDVDNFSCPCCGSHDRERHLLLYWRKIRFHERMAGAAVLHFAPEPNVSAAVLAAQPAQYVKADLFPCAADVVKIDMLSIPYGDETFDVVIANHVMEHIPDYRSALREIRRVLKPGGVAILQTPYSPVLHGHLCDDGIDSPDSRNQFYGQEDHARLFGREVFEDFSAIGFLNRMEEHTDLLPEIDANHFGVNCMEPLFMFERK